MLVRCQQANQTASGIDGCGGWGGGGVLAFTPGDSQPLRLPKALPSLREAACLLPEPGQPHSLRCSLEPPAEPVKIPT